MLSITHRRKPVSSARADHSSLTSATAVDAILK